MKILYLLSQYVSHLKAGRDYIRAMRFLGVEMVNNLESADVVVIHDEPPSYPLYFQKLPILRDKYTIAYAVWETDILPDIYIEGLQLVDEIWTCSQFSREIFAKSFDNVYKVPHVVTRHDVNPSDMLEIKRRLAYDPEAYYFYTIADSVNPRKNLLATVDAFVRLRSLVEKRIFLVVKQYRNALPYLASLPNVISIDQHLDDGRIHALHEICNCYVSSHCAEAWGLSISDAMAFGNLVVATGYSGNMEYMNHENSFPVRYTLTHIREEDLRFQPVLLNRKMSWAYIDVNDLIGKMFCCLESVDHGEKRDNARMVADHYSHMRIADIIMKRLSLLG